MAKKPLIIVKPKKKIADMTDEERAKFAAQIVGAAKASNPPEGLMYSLDQPRDDHGRWI